MAMSWILGGIFSLSLAAALYFGRGAALSAAMLQGAQSGVTLAVSMTGAICLWTGLGRLLGRVGITGLLSRLLSPLLGWLFPSSREDPALAQALSGNICSNFLGLGNAATPMGIQAVQRMQAHSPAGTASDEMCRLIVLNTASIQLIPATVASVRAGLGCETPFDILPAVWLTSLCSAGLGVIAAMLLGKVWRHG